MNFYKKTGILVLSLLTMTGVYYGSYKLYQYQVGNKDMEKYQELYEAKEANRTKEQTIHPKTTLVVEHYNRTEESVVEETAVMPVEYIGMNREELTQYLETYSKNPDLQDVQNGFEKYQLISFSDSQVVLRKISVTPGTEYKFYLAEANGCVTVYYIDRKTVYEYTNIVVDCLPDDVKQQILRGKYVTDEDALFAFLETYTS